MGNGAFDFKGAMNQAANSTVDWVKQQPDYQKKVHAWYQEPTLPHSVYQQAGSNIANGIRSAAPEAFNAFNPPQDAVTANFFSGKGSMSPTQTPLQKFTEGQGQYESEMGAMRRRAEADRDIASKMQFKRLANPWDDNNPMLQGQMSQIAGRGGQMLANLNQNTMADQARTGVAQNGGMAASQQNSNNLKLANWQADGLNGAMTQNYDRRQQHDLGQQSLEQQFDQQKINNNITGMNQIQGLNQAAYNMGSQTYGDTLHFGQSEQMFPGQLEAQGLQNRYGQGTINGRMSAENARNNLGTYTDNFNQGEASYWNTGDNLDFSRGVKHTQRGYQPWADGFNAFAAPIGVAGGTAIKAAGFGGPGK